MNLVTVFPGNSETEYDDHGSLKQEMVSHVGLSWGLSLSQQIQVNCKHQTPSMGKS